MYWISTKKEMPKEQNQILVLIDGRHALVAKYNGFSFTDDGLEVEDITHWCYLPKIPLYRLL